MPAECLACRNKFCGCFLGESGFSGESAYQIPRHPSVGNPAGDFTSCPGGKCAPNDEVDVVAHALDRAVDKCHLHLTGMETPRGDNRIGRRSRIAVLTFLPRVVIGIDDLAVERERYEGIGSERRGEARVMHAAIRPFRVPRVFDIRPRSDDGRCFLSRVGSFHGR